MQWRKAWEKNWDSMRYCSDSCRRDKFDKNSIHVREAILILTKKSGPSKPVPQEDVVKYLWPHEGLTRLEEVRRVARILHSEELITIIQNGRPITDLNFKGPAQFIIKLG
jgi:hypothetical protein